ncbi:hypothetical protein [Thalassobacillus pellis]|uniref:hypothetical protein n=1 Tax=Thalassobacillus pellis TaxID=748008 RepID=UPI00196217E1|nr:TM2 domain-containing membrane protein YozV [Thalassobacillus pellis]
MEKNPVEKLLWSVALPGFGQFLNGKYFKGTLLVILEFLINVQANFNVLIISSFQGDIQKAVEQADYAWLMFYPCLYFFAIWDAWKDAGGGKSRYDFLPFVFAAYFVTIGLIYSSSLTLFNILLGPLWLPMLFVIPGIASGFLIQKVMIKITG